MTKAAGVRQIFVKLARFAVRDARHRGDTYS